MELANSPLQTPVNRVKIIGYCARQRLTSRSDCRRPQRAASLRPCAGRGRNIKSDDRARVGLRPSLTESARLLKGCRDTESRISPREFPFSGVCRVKALSGGAMHRNLSGTADNPSHAFCVRRFYFPAIPLVQAQGMVQAMTGVDRALHDLKS